MCVINHKFRRFRVGICFSVILLTLVLIIIGSITINLVSFLLVQLYSFWWVALIWFIAVVNFGINIELEACLLGTI